DNLFLKYENQKLLEVLSSDVLTPEFFGKGKSISKVLNMVEKLSKSDSTTILVQGESGTGKEMIAKYIHQNSPRRDKVFVTINCGTIPRELAESELFGHEKGAFTGAAQKTKLGKFELADGGTLLLDEIGELSLDMQVKLLRVLQERRFYRLGGEREISVDVRVLAASNKDLEAEARKGNFREDLLYRLDVAKVIIPPLRERKEDIANLVHLFIEEFSQRFSKQIKGVDPEAIEFLSNQYWRGNVRELRNAVERAMLMVESEELKVQNFGFLKKEDDKKVSDESFVLKVPKTGIKIDAVLRSLILQTLEITKGNQVKAAKVLGLSRSKLRYRMEQLGIEVTKSIQ
ncbi:MAG TPA: sigma-54 dependent transcriptional regulator, partial [Ignavibacteriaceae bacterium]|nr:sigma-54 dependent transcriptional regulator [Ignavibacteriaceae bacterium]